MSGGAVYLPTVGGSGASVQINLPQITVGIAA
jgi:hypothetical protein